MPMRNTTLILLLLVPFLLSSQQAVQQGSKVKSKEPSTDYDRISLTYLLLDFSQSGGQNSNFDLLKSVFPSVKVSDKFDDNRIGRYLVSSPVTRQETENAFLFNPRAGNEITKKVQSTLQSGYYPNEVIAKWFSRKADGTFGVELLQQRGLYNATDYDVKAAGASKLGMAKLMDAGEQLLNKSYLIVFDVSDLITKEEDYNRQQKNSKTTINRIKNGYLGTVNAYLFKIDFNDTISSIFWQQFWAEQGDPALAAKKAAFDQYQFPLSYVFRTSSRVEASQFNPGQALAPKVQATPEQLMEKLVSEGVSNVLFNIERSLEEFKVKTVLFSRRPLTAKIGLKENLRLDQRYFVYEMRQNNRGEVYSHKMGVVRATRHITDNRQVSTGQTKPSRFYQVAGKRLDEGMLLQQRNDLGFSLGIGVNSGGTGGFDARLEYNLSLLFRKKAPSLIKLYFSGGYEPASYDMVINSMNYTYEDFIRFEGGLGKEFCFMRNLKLQPFAGFGLEQITDVDDSKRTLSSFYGRYGFMLGLNIFHNLQLTGTWSNHLMNGTITDQDNLGFTLDGKDAWGDAFERGGATMNFGIRLEF